MGRSALSSRFMVIRSTAKTFPRWVAIGFAAILPACVGGSSRGVPLYSPETPRRAENTIAALLGDIATVDGRDVSGSGRTFELLPGCHVITTRRSFGKVEQGLPMTALLPPLTFVLPMHANRSYLLEYEPSSNAGNGGVALIQAREVDASGKVLATHLPTSDKALVEHCLQTGKTARG